VFAESENLVKNPGFEEGNDESVYFWQTHCWEKLKELQNFLLMNPYTIPEAKVRA